MPILLFVGIGMCFFYQAKAQNEYYIGPDNLKTQLIDKVPEAYWLPYNKFAPANKMSFWGDGQNCKTFYQGGRNEPTRVVSNITSPNKSSQTGVGFGADSTLRRYWTPSGNTPDCASSSNGLVGPSYQYVDADPKIGGLGLFTKTGPHNFFNPYSGNGQNGSGANKYISGNVFSARFNWNNAAVAIQPWISTTDSFRIRSIQSVAYNKITQDLQQGKQQITVTFINTYCFNVQKIGACQMNFLFNAALYRHDQNYFNTPKGQWWKNVRVWADPAQMGMTIIDGPIPQVGQTAVEKSSGLAIFRSMASPTQFDNFANLLFDVRISFQNLKNAARLSTALKLTKAVSQVTSADVATQFGANWADPDSWSVVSLNFAQEVYNPYFTAQEATIGGSLQSMQAGPETLPLR